LFDLPALPALSRVVAVGILAFGGLLINWPRHLPTDRVNYAAELHANVGVGLQTRGRLAESVVEYQEALRLQPDSADAHRFLGTAYRELGRQAPATQEFERAVALRPDHDAALQDLAVMRYQQGRVAESVELLRKALALNPENHQVMLNLGVGLLRLNARAEGAEWLRRAGIPERQVRRMAERAGAGAVTDGKPEGTPPVP